MSDELNDEITPDENEALPTEEPEADITPEETDFDITSEETDFDITPEETETGITQEEIETDRIPEETDSDITPEEVDDDPVDFEKKEEVEEAEWTEDENKGEDESNSEDESKAGDESKDETVTVESVLKNKLPIKVNREIGKGKTKNKEIDEALVEKAVLKITEITSAHLSNMILEVGQYLIDEFFDGDLELARKKKGNKMQSLNQVITQMVDSGEKDYSKSWMYNSINLVLENKELEGFHSYGKLSTSCKVLLLPVKDKKIKKALIEKTVEENLSVSKLRELIKQGKKDKQDFVSFLKNVRSVQDNSLDEIYRKYNTIKFDDEEYKEILKTVNSQIDKYVSMGVTIELTISKYREIKEEVKKYSKKNLKK
jgi:hypothetical protein